MNTIPEKELTFEVSEAEYQEGLAKGWNDDDMLRPGTYKVRRATRFAKPGDLHPSNTTVHTNLPVTLDVYQYFEKRAQERGAESAEKLMAAELRAVMERDQQSEIQKETATEPQLQAA